MAEKLALVDYGAGNLHSVENALRAAGAEDVTVTADPNVVRAADRVLVVHPLGGVGDIVAGSEHGCTLLSQTPLYLHFTQPGHRSAHSSR